jgi:hypothetical protein
MIHYHGLPITPATAAAKVMTGRHAFVSFAHQQQLDVALEVCQSFALDNGAFSAWRGTYQPATKEWRAMVMADRIEAHNSASAWDSAMVQMNLLDKTA